MQGPGRGRPVGGRVRFVSGIYTIALYFYQKLQTRAAPAPGRLIAEPAVDGASIAAPPTALNGLNGNSTLAHCPLSHLSPLWVPAVVSGQ